MDRRRFIKVSGLAGVGIAALGATGLALRSTLLAERIPTLKFFSKEEFSIFAALAERLLPIPPDFPDAHLVVAESADAFLASCEQVQVQDMKKVLRLFDNALAGLLITHSVTPFTRMDADAKDVTIEKWRLHKRTVFRTAFAAMKRLIYATYYGNDRTWAAVGYPGPPDLAGVDVMAEPGEGG